MENANGSWNYIGVHKVQRGLGRTNGFKSLRLRLCVRGTCGICIERLVCVWGSLLRSGYVKAIILCQEIKMNPWLFRRLYTYVWV